MSFVAEAAVGGRRKGYRRVVKGLEGRGNKRKSAIPATLARTTEDPDRVLRDPNHNNDNEKKSDGHFSREERLGRSKFIPQTAERVKE